MADVDAARAEVTGEPHAIAFKGQEFRFPADSADLPLEFLEHLNNGSWVRALYAALGDQADEFRKLKPTIREGDDLLGQLAQAYGFANVGESSASNGSSPSTSGRSRPTSLASTG